jgi:hypothetical protein
MNAPHSRSTPLLLLALLTVAHLLGVALLLGEPRALTLLHECVFWAASLLGIAGTVRATRAFAPGDHLRRVWGLLAVGAGLLFVGTAMRSYWFAVAGSAPFASSPLLPYRMAVVVAANVVSTYALVLLAFTYQRAGLSPPTTWRSALLWCAGLAAALCVAVPQLRLDLAQLQLGSSSALSATTSLVSTLGDTLTILLTVPLLRVAYLMRGGRLAQVWWVMGLSGAAWLLYDARAWLALGAAGHEAAALELLRVTRTVGLAAVGVAGWLQHAALAATSAQPAPRPAVSEPVPPVA